MKRCIQLAKALEEIGGGHFDYLPDSIRRVLKLFEMCPWLSEESPLGKPKANKKRKAEERVA